MSRIGKRIIQIPQGVEVQIKQGGDFAYKEVSVKGPKGELKQSIQRGLDFVMNNNEVEIVRLDDTKQSRSYHGLYRTLIQNMIDGVTQGFNKSLEIVGIGYRAEVQNENLILSIGYSHKINYVSPLGIIIKVQDQTNITIEGANKQLVGEVAAKIRSFRKPEPYKGKGIRYKGEKIKKKSTKTASK